MVDIKVIPLKWTMTSSENVTEKAKVIIPVELAGIVCDMTVSKLLRRNVTSLQLLTQMAKVFNRIVVVSR